MNWTEEKVKALPDGDLLQLLENAVRKTDAHTIGLCEREVERRGLVRKKKPRRNHDPLRIRENELAADIAEFAIRLAGEYDLSAETARWLSAGVPNFRAHNLTQANGAAKIGGLQKSGRCRIDRYISYRVRDRLVSLNVWLGNDSGEEIAFQVFAPQDVLPEGEPLASLRPSAADDAEMRLFQWGRRFHDLKAAKACFAEVLGAVAPRR